MEYIMLEVLSSLAVKVRKVEATQLLSLESMEWLYKFNSDSSNDLAQQGHRYIRKSFAPMSFMFYTLGA